MRGIIAGLAVLAAQGAQAAEPPKCLTRAQINDATLFLLPSVLDAVAAKCRASLPANAYLLNGGQALSRRLAATGEGHWQGAVSILTQLAGDKKLPTSSLSPETARALVRDVLANEVLKKLRTTDCGRINEGLDILAPLPPENIGRMVALFIDIGGEADRAKGKSGPPPICP
ncbi:MAG: hypothetical protein JO013_10615 [Alphaproteobacteria bacterium]|nr:hypothetical protein [Alphaproteobacteria bacterium]